MSAHRGKADVPPQAATSVFDPERTSDIECRIFRPPVCISQGWSTRTGSSRSRAERTLRRIIAKNPELLRELVLDVTTIAALVNPVNANVADQRLMDPRHSPKTGLRSCPCALQRLRWAFTEMFAIFDREATEVKEAPGHSNIGNARRPFVMEQRVVDAR
jgi:hypothetical protein